MSGARSRNKGNQYERDIAKEMRENFFEHCQTSRYASREKDDACVDLVNTDPFNVQCKNWKNAPNLHKELKKMPNDTNYNLIFHKRPRQGEIVAMKKEDFYELLMLLIQAEVI